jgi:hypothetical protein
MNTEVVQSLDALALNDRRLLNDAGTVLTHGSHPVRCGRKPSLPGFVKDDKLLRANFGKQPKPCSLLNRAMPAL